jgi:hypothetical protein
MSECSPHRNNRKYSVIGQLSCLCVGKCSLNRLDEFKWIIHLDVTSILGFQWRRTIIIDAKSIRIAGQENLMVIVVTESNHQVITK